MSKQILSKCWSIRIAGISLLLITLFTWQFMAIHPHWSELEKTHIDHGPPKPRVAIVAFITGPQTYLHLGLQNKDHYAKVHNYDLYVDYESHSTRGTTWLKFDMVERIIKAGQHDWIWYIDFDVLITNYDVSLTKLIDESLANTTMPDAIDFLVTDDCNGLNDGSFIVRSSPRSIEFLNAIRAVHDREKAQSGKLLGDQDSMQALLQSNNPLTQHALRIPQWKINAFPTEIGCYDMHKREWEKGMFVVHFAGAWAHVSGEDPTGQLMKKYKSQII